MVNNLAWDLVLSCCKWKVFPWPEPGNLGGLSASSGMMLFSIPFNLVIFLKVLRLICIQWPFCCLSTNWHKPGHIPKLETSFWTHWLCTQLPGYNLVIPADELIKAFSILIAKHVYKEHGLSCISLLWLLKRVTYHLTMLSLIDLHIFSPSVDKC